MIPKPRYPKVLELAKVEGNKGFKFIGQNLNQFFFSNSDRSGTSVSYMGDVNGDGLDDFIVGAPGATTPIFSPGAGQSYAIFGNSNFSQNVISLSNLDGNNGFIMNGMAGRDKSGYSVSGAGDLNGDGVNDMVIGAPNSVNYAAGQSYIVFGKRGLRDTTLELSNLDGSNGFVFTGGSLNGFSVSSVGDVNGDGMSDIIIGVPQGGVVNAAAGQSCVVFGKRGVWGSIFPLTNLDGSNGFVINGISTEDNSGLSVSGAGDVNGDGISDIIVTSPDALNDLSQSYVVFGKRGVWSGSLSLANLDGSNGFTINVVRNINNSNCISVSNAGDVNGDGISDVIIGAPQRAFNGAGQSYVIFGKRGVWDSTFSLANLNGSNGFAINGISTGDNSGWSVGNSGDVNRDGISDIIIGAPSFANNQPGKSYVVFGKRGVWSSPFLLSSLDGTNGFILKGAQTGDNAGYSVSGAGDINGDDVSDLLIGAPGSSLNGLAGAGISYVITNATNLPPWFVNTTQLTIGQGQTQAFLFPKNIHATDDWTLDENLQIIISNPQHAQFELTGAPVTEFNQGDVIAGRITFVHDGSDNAPSFDISVNDGTLTTGPVSATVNFTLNPSNDNTRNVGIIGAVVGSILGVAALLGLSVIYFRSKAKQELDQAIETGKTGIPQQSNFRREALYPVAKEVYRQIKITGCLGQLNKQIAKEFVAAIETLLGELQQLVNLNIEQMSIDDQQKFFKEIVKHIRLHTIPQSARCTRFFKAEVTPVQIEEKASAIAAAVSKALTTSTTNEVHNVLNKDVELEENSTPYVRLER